MTLDAVQSSVKDTNLVKIRREQIAFPGDGEALFGKPKSLTCDAVPG